jgi:predicted amidohydrolase YtcJ
VIVVQNPSHFTSVSLLHQRYKGKMEQHAFAMRSLIDLGIPVALGSDGPLNPFLNIMFACINPYNPREALTVEEAITAYTLTAAFAEFEEKNKGSIEVGKLADLAVLSQDIFTIPLQQLPATVSVMTILDGRESF